MLRDPAKFSDPRAADYISKFGNESWELDALDPKVIDGLISKEIEQYVDWEIWEQTKEREKRAKVKLKEIAENWKDE